MPRQTKVALAGTVMFAGCSRRDLSLIAAVAARLSVPASRVLARQGARSGEFCVLIEGAADVTVNGEFTKAFSAGDFFGESSMNAEVSSRATITTTAPTKLLVIVGRDFGRLLTAIPHIRIYLDAVAVRRAAALSA